MWGSWRVGGSTHGFKAATTFQLTLLERVVLHFTCLLSLAAMAPGQNTSTTRPTVDTVPYFPATNGSSLMRRKFTLPHDFEGELNVVLIAFKRGQQADVDTWTPHLRPLTAQDTTLRVYELPVLSRTLTLMRSFIDGGMRGGIPDTAVRAATITMYINKTPFKRALGITSEDSIEVLLVDRAGTIHWRTTGSFREGALTELEAALHR